MVSAYARCGQAREAIAIATEQAAAARKRFSADSAQLSTELRMLGRALMDGKLYVAAEPILRESLAIAETQLPDTWDTHGLRSQLGETMVGQNRFAEAEPLVVQGYLGQKKLVAKMPREARGYLITAGERIVDLYEAWGKPDEATKWRMEVEEIRARP